MIRISPRFKRQETTLVLVLILFLFFLLMYLEPQKKVVQYTSVKKTKFLPAEIDKINEGNLATKFLQQVELPVLGGKPDKLIYRVNGLGTFVLPEFNYIKEKEIIRFEMFPPSYKKSVIFFAKRKEELIPIGIKNFVQPKSDFYRDMKVKVKGAFSVPFFAITGIYYYYQSLNDARIVYPMIINKFGEVVWAHNPKKRNSKYATIKKTKNGNYAILYSEQDSYFEVVTPKGQVLYQLNGRRDFKEPTVIHHDFVYDEDKNQLICFSNEIVHVRNMSWFSNYLSFKDDLLLRPMSYVLTPLISIDLKTKKKNVLWDPKEFFRLNDSRQFLLRHGIERLIKDKKGSYWASWNKRVQFDFMHANSIQKIENEGYLISLRNMDRVLLLSLDFKKALWSIGPDDIDTHRPADIRHQFFQQHHASYLGNGKVLLIDNHPSPPAPFPLGSRVLLLKKVDDLKLFKAVWNYQPKIELKSINRGSAYSLKNNNVIAYYPDSFLNYDYLIEINYKDGLPLGQMKIAFSHTKKIASEKQKKEFLGKGLTLLDEVYRGGGNRALPVDHIGSEVFRKF